MKERETVECVIDTQCAEWPMRVLEDIHVSSLCSNENVMRAFVCQLFFKMHQEIMKKCHLIGSTCTCTINSMKIISIE